MSITPERLSMYALSKNITAGVIDYKLYQNGVNIVRIPSNDACVDLEEIFPSELHPEVFPADELRSLYKRIKLYMSDVEKKADKLKQFVRPEILTNKKAEYIKLLQEIEAYAKQENILLTNDKPKKESDVTIQEIEKRLAEIQIITEFEKSDETSTEFGLSNDLEISELVIIVKKLQVLLQKLVKIESVIGDEQIFKDRSVCLTLEEEVDLFQSLEKFEIQKNIKKVEFIIGDFNKHIGENKRPFFEASFRKQVLDFLTRFFQDFPECKLDNISKIVSSTIDNIENHGVFLNEFSKNLESLRSYQQTLQETIKQAEENRETLKNFKIQTQQNLNLFTKNKTLFK